MWGDKLKIKFICIYLMLEDTVYIIANSDLFNQEFIPKLIPYITDIFSTQLELRHITTEIWIPISNGNSYLFSNIYDHT